MPYRTFDLPQYPATTDMWQSLKDEKRPIMVYGMGNGADKLFERFSILGINVTEIFASDGFVRGHSFRGYKVKSFSEIKENYSDFVIVLSFASNKSYVIDMLSEINREYDMYVPDMPVAGVDEYFDKDFYNSHYSEIKTAYDSLADDESRAVYSSVINYKLSGRMSYLLECYTELDNMYSLIPKENIRCAIDAGAYNGDTARQMIEYFPNIKKIYAVEPDKKNFKKLQRYSEAETDCKMIAINSAVWCENSSGIFFGSGNRNSTVVATASYEHSEEDVSMVKLDSITDEKIDYIKYDVEGAEQEALLGSFDTISKYNPTLLVSLYHRSRDIFTLTNYIKNEYPDYSLYLRRLRCLPAWEINLIAINENLRKEFDNEKT